QCRLADGVPTSSDGVYGMRRAAGLAGVRTFVAPLWSVNDQAQATLMQYFYSQLSFGRDRAEALRRAKQRLLSNRETSHFLLWAPVILIGEIGPVPASLFRPSGGQTPTGK